MSKRELERIEVLARVRSKQLRLVDAGRLMRLCYRQAKRLWKRYREEGAAGPKHRSTGQASHHAHELKFRRKVLQLIREKYGGPVGERFGPTLAAEHLAAEDALQVNAETPPLRPKRFALRATQGCALGQATDRKNQRCHGPYAIEIVALSAT